MVGAERENFEDLELLDCRKRRFQSLNFTFFGTLVQVYCLIPQNLPNFSALSFFGGAAASPAPPPPSRTPMKVLGVLI